MFLTSLDSSNTELDLMKEVQHTGSEETPLFSLLKASTHKSRRTANPADGISWDFMDVPDGDDDNAHLEGGDAATTESYETGRLTNHYQIFKHAFGVSGSMKPQMQVNGKGIMAEQGVMAEIKHRKTIEIALHKSAAPVQRGAAVEGKMGGILSFLTAETDIDTTLDTLDWKILREMLKVGFMNGCRVTHLLMNDTQKDVLDDILFSKTMLNDLRSTKIDNNVTVIGNTAYGNNIRVVLDPFLGAGEVVGLNTNMMGIVAHRPTLIEDLVTTKDVVEKQYLTEMTTYVTNRYGVLRLKNLATA